MPTNFPSVLDSFPTHIDNVTDVLAAHSNNMQDAIAALQAKVGVDNSNVPTSLDYKKANRDQLIGVDASLTSMPVNIWYTNSSNRPVWVGGSDSGSGAAYQISQDGGSTVVTLAQNQAPGSGQYEQHSFSFMVPPGWSFRFLGSTFKTAYMIG